jgi:hypothetical protein
MGKPKKIFPKVKQRNVFKKVMNEGKSVTVAMREEKYAEATIENPKNVTESKGWQQLMEQYLPDEELAKVHQEGLKAVRIHSSMTEPDRIENDYAVRHKYLDTAYKLKGAYAPEKSVNLNVELKANLSEEKIDEINQLALDE